MIDLNANNGAGSTSIHVGKAASLTAKLTGGVGKCQLVVPADAALRLRVTTGLGKVQVPDQLVAVKVDQFVATSGTWETPGFAEAEHKIEVRFEGGVGNFSVELV
jgi:predicted membrane protein